MPTQYTPILKLALPVEGELDGTWGDTVNDNITSMVEQAVAGAATINTWTANVHTLTTADGTTSESRCAALIAQTGAGGTALTAAGQIICPTATKLYVLKNDSAYAVTLKTASGTGIAVPSGTAAFLFCDGTNVQSSQTTLTLPSGTANGVVYLDGSKVATAGSALTFDGTNLATTGAVILNNTQYYQGKNAAGTAVRLLGINASNVAYVGPIDSGPTEINYGAATTVTAQYWNTGGTERMRLDTSGNLGIGTSSPGVRLDVSGADGVRARVVATSGGTSGMILSSAGNTAYTIKAGNADNSLRIDQDGTDRLTLASGGNLGIGTSSPAEKLDVVGNVRISSGSSFYWGDATSQITATNGGAMRFLTGTAAEKMRLDASGNLGIGTTSPAVRLDVSGDSNFRGLARIFATAGNISVLSFFQSGVFEWTIGQRVNGNFVFNNGGSFAGNDYLTLDTNGALGLGVTPSVGYGKEFSISADVASGVGGLGVRNLAANNNITYLSNNVKNTGAFTDSYWASTLATKYQQDNGGHKWFTAPSGTAGNAITFTQAMTLDASGNLLVGGTANPYSNTNRGVVQSNGTASAMFGLAVNGVAAGYWISNGSLMTLGAPTGHAINFDINGERMRLDASGNLGLGVTPSAWNNKAIDVDSYASFASWNNATGVGNNVWRNSTPNFVYKNTAAAAMYLQTAGQHIFYTAPSGTAGNTFTFTQAMTLDASGNLLVGRTSALNNGTIEALGSGQQAFVGQVTSNTNSNFQGFSSSGQATFQVTGGGDLQLRRDDSGPTFTFVNGDMAANERIGQIRFTSNGVTGQSSVIDSYGGSSSVDFTDLRFSTAYGGVVGERMRLDSQGNLGLNTATFGTSAAGVLSLGTGTAPSTGPADTVQIFSVDRSAGNTIPAVRCEGSGVTNAGITNTTVTNKIAIQVNGTIYYLLATTNAT